jgi:hypothetical protein
LRDLLTLFDETSIALVEMMNEPTPSGFLCAIIRAVRACEARPAPARAWPPRSGETPAFGIKNV